MTKEESAKLLDKAAEICVNKHSGQRDKMGCAYFQHPMRVAMRCNTDEEKIVALLHDTIEDTDVTAEYLLAEGFPQYIIDGILSVTKRDGESYEEFVGRAAQNPLGRVVKLHDLEDNLDVLRLDTVNPEMAARLTKYLAARSFLLGNDAPEESVTLQSGQHETKPAPRSYDEMYVELRKVANRNITSRDKPTGGSKRMKDRLIISDKSKTVINESSISKTMEALGKMLGYSTIAKAGIMVENDYRLVTDSTNSPKYDKTNSSWYVISNIPVLKVARALNDLFDKLNVRLIANVVDR